MQLFTKTILINSIFILFSIEIFTKIPKFSQFKILDLSNIALALKYYYSLISSDEFWNYKTFNEYGSFVFSKPQNIKEWYNRVNN